MSRRTVSADLFMSQSIELGKVYKAHNRAYDILVKTWEGFGFSGGDKYLSSKEQIKLWNRLKSILNDEDVKPEPPTPNVGSPEQALALSTIQSACDRADRTFATDRYSEAFNVILAILNGSASEPTPNLDLYREENKHQTNFKGGEPRDGGEG